MNPRDTIVEEAAVVVVGGGPAGTMVAHTIAAQGHDVVLVDRSSFPREKACGDGIIASGVSFLSERGLAHVLKGAYPIEGTRVFVDWSAREARRRTVKGVSPVRQGCSLERASFDNALLTAAEEAGARFVKANATGVFYRGGKIGGLTVTRDGRSARLLAGKVVAADGASSRLRRILFGGRLSERATACAVRQYVRTEGALLPLFEFFVPIEGVLPGIGWVIPVSDHVANVGVGYVSARGMCKVPRITDMLQWFVRGLVEHRGSDLGKLAVIGRARGAPLGINFVRGMIERDGVLFVGDAARTCDPLTGEGIDAAMRSGYAAAMALDQTLRRRRSTTRGPTDFGASRPRLGQDSGMVARLGRELLKQREAGRLAAPGMPAERMLMGRSGLSMLFADDDYPTASGSPAGGLAEQLGYGEVMTAMDDCFRKGAETELVLCSEMMCREMYAGLGPVGALVLIASYEAVRLELVASVNEGAAAVELLGMVPYFLSRVVNVGGKGAVVNNALAVMMADYSLARACSLMLGSGDRVTRMVAQAIKAYSEGVAVGERDRNRAGRSIEQYLEWSMLLGGEKASLAARVGGALAGAQGGVVGALGEFGQLLGVAVQICEDSAALVRTDPISGRQPRQVLEEGSYALPVIYALEEGAVSVSQLMGSKDESGWEGVVTAIRDSCAIKRSQELCAWYAAKAKRSIPKCIGSESVLSQLCDLPVQVLMADHEWRGGSRRADRVAGETREAS